MQLEKKSGHLTTVFLWQTWSIPLENSFTSLVLLQPWQKTVTSSPIPTTSKHKYSLSQYCRNCLLLFPMINEPLQLHVAISHHSEVHICHQSKLVPLVVSFEARTFCLFFALGCYLGMRTSVSWATIMLAPQRNASLRKNHLL